MIDLQQLQEKLKEEQTYLKRCDGEVQYWQEEATLARSRTASLEREIANFEKRPDEDLELESRLEDLQGVGQKKITDMKDKNGIDIKVGQIVNCTLYGWVQDTIKAIIVEIDYDMGIIALEDVVMVNNAKGQFKSLDGCDTTKNIEVLTDPEIIIRNQ